MLLPESRIGSSSINNGSNLLSSGNSQNLQQAKSNDNNYDEFLPLNTDNSTIFVSIPSYRDPECEKTIRSLFTNAVNKDRIHVGVFEQNMPGDISALPVSIASDMRLGKNVRILRTSALNAKGPCYARAIIESNLINDDEAFELYFCVDSHMRFTRGWDRRYIEELLEIQDNRAVLSTYPANYIRTGTVGAATTAVNYNNNATAAVVSNNSNHSSQQKNMSNNNGRTQTNRRGTNQTQNGINQLQKNNLLNGNSSYSANNNNNGIMNANSTMNSNGSTSQQQQRLWDVRSILYRDETDIVNITDPTTFMAFHSWDRDTGMPMHSSHQMCTIPQRHYQNAFYSGGCAFSRAEVVDEVPHDPNTSYLFTGEEQSIAARLYTSGWNTYIPKASLVYSLSDRTYRNTYWELLRNSPSKQVAVVDMATAAEHQLIKNMSINRIRNLLYSGHLENSDEDACYGLGSVRSLSDYENFAGIFIKRQLATERARLGISYESSDMEWRDKYSARRGDAKDILDLISKTNKCPLEGPPAPELKLMNKKNMVQSKQMLEKRQRDQRMKNEMFAPMSGMPINTTMTLPLNDKVMTSINRGKPKY